VADVEALSLRHLYEVHQLRRRRVGGRASVWPTYFCV